MWHGPEAPVAPTSFKTAMSWVLSVPTTLAGVGLPVADVGHGDARGAVDDVVVGEDVTGGVEDHAGAGRLATGEAEPGGDVDDAGVHLRRDGAGLRPRPTGQGDEGRAVTESGSGCLAAHRHPEQRRRWRRGRPTAMMWSGRFRTGWMGRHPDGRPAPLPRGPLARRRPTVAAAPAAPTPGLPAQRCRAAARVGPWERRSDPGVGLRMLRRGLHPGRSSRSTPLLAGLGAAVALPCLRPSRQLLPVSPLSAPA